MFSGYAQAIYDALHSRLEVLDPPAIFWIHEGQAVFKPGLYVSLHRVGLPPVQANAPPVNPKRPDPWSYYYPRMVSKEDFWSALVPAKWAYEDLLLPLARIDVLPVSVKDGTEYRLGNLKDWQLVEESLRSLVKNLDRVAAWTSVDIEFTPWPCDYGYHGTFKSQKILMKVMKKIRAVFVLVIARLTYLVFLLRNRKDGWLEHVPFHPTLR